MERLAIYCIDIAIILGLFVGVGMPAAWAITSIWPAVPFWPAAILFALALSAGFSSRK